MADTPDKPRSNLYRRVTGSVPLLITVLVHVVLIAIAGYFVVSEQIIGKKKTFEAPPPSDNSAVQKQVEHRLQVARKGGGSASSSPVSAARIMSTSADALQMPSMPDLPQVGASSLSGMGFGAGMGAVGGGSGYNTGIGNGNGLGKGFMSMSFLGVTTQRASKIIFIVDIGRDLLDIRKGGFEGFKIIREEIMKLISRLPPSCEFNVILFENGVWSNSAVATFDTKLVPATVGNKAAFFEWLKPVNATPEIVGLASTSRRITWTPKPLDNAGIDPTLLPPDWAKALQCALEMQPDTVYIIAGGQGALRHRISEAELEKRKRENDKYLADLKRDGLDVNAITAARNASMAKANAQLADVNAKLKAAGKTPFIVVNTQRIFAADFQAALKRAGFEIKLDTAGWTNKQGQPIWWTGYNNIAAVPFDELYLHISKLQRALLRDRAALNFFLFVGPNEEPKTEMDNLSKVSSKNGGKFELITTKRLQEISKRDEQKK